jgi:hypothetical protein
MKNSMTGNLMYVHLLLFVHLKFKNNDFNTFKILILYKTRKLGNEMDLKRYRLPGLHRNRWRAFVGLLFFSISSCWKILQTRWIGNSFRDQDISVTKLVLHSNEQ